MFWKMNKWCRSVININNKISLFCHLGTKWSAHWGQSRYKTTTMNIKENWSFFIGHLWEIEKIHSLIFVFTIWDIKLFFKSFWFCWHGSLHKPFCAVEELSYAPCTQVIKFFHISPWDWFMQPLKFHTKSFFQ